MSGGDTCILLRHVTLKKHTYIIHTYILFLSQENAVDMHNVSGAFLPLPTSTANSTVSNRTYMTYSLLYRIRQSLPIRKQ